MEDLLERFGQLGYIIVRVWEGVGNKIEEEGWSGWVGEFFGVCVYIYIVVYFLCFPLKEHEKGEDGTQQKQMMFFL